MFHLVQSSLGLNCAFSIHRMQNIQSEIKMYVFSVLFNYIFESEHRVQGSKTWRGNGIFGLWIYKLLGDGFCQDLFLWLFRHQLFYFSWIFNSNTMENFGNQMSVHASNARKKWNSTLNSKKLLEWFFKAKYFKQKINKWFICLEMNSSAKTIFSHYFKCSCRKI